MFEATNLTQYKMGTVFDKPVTSRLAVIAAVFGRVGVHTFKLHNMFYFTMPFEEMCP